MTGAGSAPGTVTPVDERVALANASGRVPVVFIHALWPLAASRERWARLFAEAPAVIARAACKRQRHNPGVTEFAELAGRGHSLILGHGWAGVAQTAPDFINRFT